MKSQPSPIVSRREFLAATASAAIATGCSTQLPRSAMTMRPHPDSRVYELRIYTTNPGKADALHNRFRNHTLRLFNKHGIESVGYWMPLDPADGRLHFLLRYPSREAREASWKAFGSDPDWQAAYKASEAGGAILAKGPDVSFVQLTDYSPSVVIGPGLNPRVFELRTYTTPAGLLPNLDARFRNHTLNLFKRHGMTNYAYWHRMADQEAADTTLQYLLCHRSKEAAAASFAAFRLNPEWIAARAESEKTANGSLTVPNGVQGVFLAATDYSPTK